MKLYTWGPAPNPRRVRIFIAEKGIDIAIEDVGDRAQLKADFLARDPNRLTPVLELDDGTLIGEAAAICRYLEALYPEPALLGRNPKESALIDMWERKCEFEGLQATAEAFRNSVPAFVDRGLGGYAVTIPQIPALIDRGRVRMNAFYAKLDAQFARGEYIAGAAFSIADITGLCAIDFAIRAKIPIPDECGRVQAWHARVSARPSAAQK